MNLNSIAHPTYKNESPKERKSIQNLLFNVSHTYSAVPTSLEGSFIATARYSQGLAVCTWLMFVKWDEQTGSRTKNLYYDLTRTKNVTGTAFPNIPTISAIVQHEVCIMSKGNSKQSATWWTWTVLHKLRVIKIIKTKNLWSCHW